MEKIIYNYLTKSADPNATLEDTRKFWYLEATNLYTIDEVKKLGKYVSGHIKLSDGTILKMYCHGESKNAIRGDNVGKVCVVQNPQNSHRQIMDLATETILYDEGLNDIEMYNDNLYSYYSKDYSSFDVIGAVDESEAALKYNGKTLFRSSNPFIPEYKDGKLAGFKCGRDFCSMEKIETKIKYVEAKQKLLDAVKELKELNVNEKDIALTFNSALKQPTIER